MRTFAIAATAVLAIAASTAVYAERQTWSHEHMRMTRKTAKPSRMRVSPLSMPG